nr:hypothetical protein [Tanacetum cinerariifolium]
SATGGRHRHRPVQRAGAWQQSGQTARCLDRAPGRSGCSSAGWIADWSRRSQPRGRAGQPRHIGRRHRHPDGCTCRALTTGEPERYLRTRCHSQRVFAPFWRVTFRRMASVNEAFAAPRSLLRNLDTPITILEATLA